MSLPKELLDAVKQDKEMLAKKIEELKVELTSILSQSKITSGNIENTNETLQSNDQSEVVNAVKDLGEKIESISIESNLETAFKDLGEKIESVSIESNSETAFSSFIEQSKIAKLDLEISEKAQNLRKFVATSSSVLNKQQLTALKAQIEILEKNNTTSIEEKEAAVNLSEQLEVAATDIVEAVKAQKPPTKEEAALQSIIEQGELAQENLKIQETVKELQTNLDRSRKSLSEEEILATENLISSLKSDKLDSIESKREAREIAEKTTESLNTIAENQSNLVKEFKSGFGELRGEGLGGLIRMLVVGIPSLLAGIVVGIGGAITGFLSQFRVFATLFAKIGSVMGPLLTTLASGFKAIGGFLTGLPAVGTFFANLFGFSSRIFALGTGLAKLAGPIGIAIAVITALIGGIKGAIKGFKEDGIIGLFREGLIGAVDGLVGGLVKAVGSVLAFFPRLLGFDKLAETIKNGFSDFVDGVLGGLRGQFNMIIGIFTLDFDLFKEGIGQMMDAIVNVIMGIIKGIGGLIIASFMTMLKAIKFLIIDLPIKLITFAGNVLKAIFFDLPVAAFKFTLDAIQLLFVQLPQLLIEKVKDFFTSMVEKIGDAFSGAFDFVKKIGAASKAALKAALPGGESPKEAFLRVMGADTGGSEGGEESGEEREERENIEEVVTTAAQETIMPSILPQPEEIQQFQSRIANAIAEIDADEDADILARSEQVKMESATRMVESGRELTNTAQPIRQQSPFGQLPISQGVDGFLSRVSDTVLGPDIMGRARRVLSSRNPVEEGKRLFERSQNRVENFGDLTPGQMLRRLMDSPGSRTGANLTSSQIENNQLTRQLTGGSPTSVIAPSTVNNSRSTVTNTTIAAPPHIDKTQALFGAAMGGLW